MKKPHVVVLGGGMAGIGAAYELARGGCSVDVVEAAAELGGLAGSFERAGHFYPLGYHHVLATDRTLREFLAITGVAKRLAWRRVRLLFQAGETLHELNSASGLARFPLPPIAKLRLLVLALYAFLRRDWTSWEGRNAAELVERWGGSAVRAVVFEPLAHLKFRRPLAELSAAWLGARLHAREGAAPFGYVPGSNWTELLCRGLHRELERLGCRVRVRSPARALLAAGERVTAVELADGRRIEADSFVSTVPTPVLRRLLPEERTPELAAIVYSALISAVCSTRQSVQPDFYWLNLSSLDRTASAIFQLSSLNPTIGREGDACLNFVTHLAGSDDPLFRESDADLMARYRSDARAVLGLELEEEWFHIARIANYSPVFLSAYRNPPVISTSFGNLYFAGNFRTHPAVASTGTALESGLEAGRALLQRQRV